ncbi:MAG TPA: hypothetical protein VFR34_14775 [Paracoccaceae bacterium]|nr:hypothetical protein [Paracoccaceae bacterium]
MGGGRCEYGLDHAVEIREDVGIPEAEHAEAARGEPGIPGLVSRPAMLAAFDFDDEGAAEIDEIDDEAADRRLAAEMGAQGVVGDPEPTPDAPLRLRHAIAKGAGLVADPRILAHCGHHPFTQVPSWRVNQARLPSKW